jgi:hypothetical protein
MVENDVKKVFTDTMKPTNSKGSEGNDEFARGCGKDIKILPRLPWPGKIFLPIIVGLGCAVSFFNLLMIMLESI